MFVWIIIIIIIIIIHTPKYSSEWVNERYIFFQICAVATQGSALYDTDFVSDYAIETSEDGNKWNVYENNGSAQVHSRWMFLVVEAPAILNFLNYEANNDT